MHGGHSDCDAACQKILLDFLMALVAAKFYQRVINRVPGLTKADYEVAQLFIDAELAFQETALWMNENRKSLGEGEWEQMMKIVDNSCYRASKYLNPWGTKETISPEMAAAWTTQLLGWIQSDQDFFVPLLKKLIDEEHH